MAVFEPRSSCVENERSATVAQPRPTTSIYSCPVNRFTKILIDMEIGTCLI